MKGYIQESGHQFPVAHQSPGWGSEGIYENEGCFYLPTGLPSQSSDWMEREKGKRKGGRKGQREGGRHRGMGEQRKEGN